MNKKEKALRNISYGIALQIFLGVGFLILAFSGLEIPEFMVSPRGIGGLLIFLAINSLCYVARYKKVLKEEG